MMIDALARNADAEVPDETFGGRWTRDESLRPAEVAFARLGALLHDIGHLPAGHTFEDELGVFAKHDSVSRIEFILDRTEWLSAPYDSLGALVDRSYAELMPLTGHDAKPRELLLALVASDYATVRGNGALGETPDFRLGVCRDLIGNTICGDLLDYLHRDLHHLGKHKQFDTRLIDYMEVRRDTAGDARLVVYLRGGDRVRTDGVSAILDLLESRYSLYEMALYHRTKLAATSMLERAVSELAAMLGDTWLEQLPEQLLDWSDAEMLVNLRAAALTAAADVEGPDRGRLEAVATQLVRVRHRVLHKKLYQRFRDQLSAPDADRIEALYAYSPDRDEARHAAGGRRVTALRQLEADFGLPPLTLAMYCPPPAMGTKVAEVQILLNGDVRSLEEHEARDRRLTGKHLEAQKERFRNLWHVYFACESEQLNMLREKKLYPVLIDAIDCFVLQRDQGPISLEDRALTVARTVASTPTCRGRVARWSTVSRLLIARPRSRSTQGGPERSPGCASSTSHEAPQRARHQVRRSRGVSTRCPSAPRGGAVPDRCRGDGPPPRPARLSGGRRTDSRQPPPRARWEDGSSSWPPARRRACAIHGRARNRSPPPRPLRSGETRRSPRILGNGAPLQCVRRVSARPRRCGRMDARGHRERPGASAPPQQAPGRAGAGLSRRRESPTWARARRRGVL